MLFRAGSLSGYIIEENGERAYAQIVHFLEFGKDVHAICQVPLNILSLSLIHISFRMRKTETEKAMRKEERYKGVLNWFKENVPVAETELHYDNPYQLLIAVIPVSYTHLILIIGGGAIDAALEQEIRQMPNTVYSTYGMTETLSHVALRRLNGPEASPYYHPFPSVTLSLSPDNTLVIDAPLVCDERLVTNDVARLLPDGSFAIIGRKDNIINSGGIKIQIEEVEERLRPYLDLPYAITAAPDPRLGEAVVLLIAPRDVYKRQTVSYRDYRSRISTLSCMLPRRRKKRS